MLLMVPVLGSFKQVSPVILDGYRLFTMYQVNMDIDHSPPTTIHSGRGGGVFFFVFIAFIVLGLTMLIYLYVLFTNSIHSVRSEYVTSTITYLKEIVG